MRIPDLQHYWILHKLDKVSTEVLHRYGICNVEGQCLHFLLKNNNEFIPPLSKLQEIASNKNFGSSDKIKFFLSIYALFWLFGSDSAESLINVDEYRY